MGVRLRGEEIKRVLADALLDARRRGVDLARDEHHVWWRDAIARLQDESTPKTYLAVTAVVLTARSLFPKETLDVRSIQAGAGERGYSAPSIGKHLAAFAKEQRIDVGAGSTQPLNNQPFTFKARIEPEMGARKHAAAWRHFFEVVEAVDELSPDEARTVLALLFHLSPRVEEVVEEIAIDVATLPALHGVQDDVAHLVATSSEGGRVGQAFVAAVLDLLFGASGVTLGVVNDPDASRVGDVHVGPSDAPWLWAEAKQKAVGTGDIIRFIERVRQSGGGRVLYAALENHQFSGHIDADRCNVEAERMGVELVIVVSPDEMLDRYMQSVPGDHASRIEALLQAFRERAVEAGCSSAVMAEIATIITAATDASAN